MIAAWVTLWSGGAISGDLLARATEFKGLELVGEKLYAARFNRADLGHSGPRLVKSPLEV